MIERILYHCKSNLIFVQAHTLVCLHIHSHTRGENHPPPESYNKFEQALDTICKLQIKSLSMFISLGIYLDLLQVDWNVANFRLECGKSIALRIWQILYTFVLRVKNNIQLIPLGIHFSRIILNYRKFANFARQYFLYFATFTTKLCNFTNFWMLFSKFRLKC